VLRAQLRKHRLSSEIELPRDRDAVSAPLVGLSNADLEAIVLLAAEYAQAGEGAQPDARVATAHLAAAAKDYLPSRDVRMLEYMELLAVFEASNRKMLPAKYAALSADELQARMDRLRLEVGNRR
jgi:hypothetical protein